MVQARRVAPSVPGAGGVHPSATVHHIGFPTWLACWVCSGDEGDSECGRPAQSAGRHDIGREAGELTPMATKLEQQEYQRIWVQIRRGFWLWQNGPCAVCGSWKELEVDHVDPSTKSAHPRDLWSRSEARRSKELAKCQVLCGLHHKIKTRREKTKPLIHGTVHGYRRKCCRCSGCRRAWADYRKNLRQARHRARQREVA